MMKNYRNRNRPVTVEAVQLTERADWDAIATWCRGKFYVEATEYPDDPEYPYIDIHTPEGKRTASYGDWIIRHGKAEFYTCPPDVFDISYDEEQP